MKGKETLNEGKGKMSKEQLLITDRGKIVSDKPHFPKLRKTLVKLAILFTIKERYLIFAGKSNYNSENRKWIASENRKWAVRWE